MPSVPDGSIDTQAEVWRFVLDRLKRRERVALLAIVESTGGTPGRAGFKMAVGAKGELAGTIGGGRMEHDLVEETRALLGRGRFEAKVLRRVHQLRHPESSGMICGGRQTIVIHACRGSDGAALEELLAGRTGSLELSPRGLVFRKMHRVRAGCRFFLRGGSWRYVERVAGPDTLYIVGGGHVGLALSRVMATLAFRIVMLDERPEVNTLAQNSAAHEKRTVAWKRVGREVPAGDRSYAVITTPGHAADECVLRQLVRKRLKYLGMMASPVKARVVLDRLRADGCPAEVLARVRTPIGLPITSRTPAEIAISIAAEIIRVRNASSAESAAHGLRDGDNLV
jgi:xanthine dehydrogenase accessory factor